MLMPFRSDRVCSLRRSPQAGRLHLDQGRYCRIHPGLVEPARQGQGYPSQLCRTSPCPSLPGLCSYQSRKKLGLPDRLACWTSTVPRTHLDPLGRRHHGRRVDEDVWRDHLDRKGRSESLPLHVITLRRGWNPN
jgi:hypothetical protein